VGQRFEFSQMESFGVRVQFAEGSLKNKEYQPIVEFISRVAK
jgi:hypothetical protein